MNRVHFEKVVVERLVAAIVAVIVVTMIITTTIVTTIMTKPVLIQSSEEVVVIEEGDTLWKYAKEYCNESIDVRKYIDIVVEYNNKEDSTVGVGESIRFPIFSTTRY